MSISKSTSNQTKIKISITSSYPKRYQEGEVALTNNVGSDSLTLPLSDFADSHGAAEYLLGLILLRTHRRKSAIVFFKLSLKINPYNWSAYKQLCEMGKLCVLFLIWLYPSFSM